jgi:hypothetical protein
MNGRVAMLGSHGHLSQLRRLVDLVLVVSRNNEQANRVTRMKKHRHLLPVVLVRWEIASEALLPWERLLFISRRQEMNLLHHWTPPRNQPLVTPCQAYLPVDAQSAMMKTKKRRKEALHNLHVYNVALLQTNAIHLP